MLSRREQIINQLIATDVHDIAQDVGRGVYDDLTALLTNGFVGYAKMSDAQLEDIWRAEGFGEL
jgi:hypothetical protein